MSLSSAAAVILPPHGEATRSTIDALERQTRPPRQVTVVHSAAELGAAVHIPAASSPSWIWLLDGGVVPEAGALEALIAAAEEASPVLLVSKVLTPGGELDPIRFRGPWRRSTVETRCGWRSGAVGAAPNRLATAQGGPDTRSRPSGVGGVRAARSGRMGVRPVAAQTSDR